MSVESSSKQKKEVRWTPHLIKQLRGKRTQTEFGVLLGVTKNTVWRWEVGRPKPEAGYAIKLSELAEREHFLQNWKLVGSVELVGDLEGAKAEIAKMFRKSLER